MIRKKTLFFLKKKKINKQVSKSQTPADFSQYIYLKVTPLPKHCPVTKGGSNSGN